MAGGRDRCPAGKLQFPSEIFRLCGSLRVEGDASVRRGVEGPQGKCVRNLSNDFILFVTRRTGANSSIMDALPEVLSRIQVPW